MCNMKLVQLYTATQHWMRGETADTNAFTILIRVLVVGLSGINHSKPQFFFVRFPATRRIDGIKRERWEETAFLKFSRGADRAHSTGTRFALNAITYQSLETRRGEAVRCILINNREATRELPPYRMPFSCSGWAINYSAGTETRWKANLSEENRAPT